MVCSKGKIKIIECDALMPALQTVANEQRATSDIFRRKTLAYLKAEILEGRKEIRRCFEANSNGLTSARSQAHLIDRILQTLYDFVVSRVYQPVGNQKAERLTVVAVGGYGRGEMAPFSDVDLLFLRPSKTSEWSERVIEYILYLLWDLGILVGHATRSVSESIQLARKNLTIRTSLLEARYIAGDRVLYKKFKERFSRRIVSGTGRDYVRRKLDERDARHQRFGDSRYLLEPNVKEGKGGLRDLHTLIWIAKYVYQVEQVAELVKSNVLTASELSRFDRAETFLWAIRSELHYLADRTEETLTFDVQQKISRRFCYADRAGTRGVERFMKHYYLIVKDVGDLTRVLCSGIEDQQRRRSLIRIPGFGPRRRELAGFVVEGDRLDVSQSDAFKLHPVKMIRLFHLADERGLDIHPHALRLVSNNLRFLGPKLRSDPEANQLFLEILCSVRDPETALRRMNEAGVFGRFILEFGRIVAQMQYDMYHVYTVDEHSIRAIGVLAKIEQGYLWSEFPLASELMHDIHSRRVLYLSLLLHDVGKGRIGNHSEIGAVITRKLAARLGLTPEEVETASWLVKNHLLMSHVAFKRDLQDPKTVSDFVDMVQGPERLRLLFVLTVVDICAVGPGRWNEWKGHLLHELYELANEALTGGSKAKGTIERAKMVRDEVRAHLADWPDQSFIDHTERMSASYWLSSDAETLARQARLVRKSEINGITPTIETRIDRFSGVSRTMVYTEDKPGLFSHIAGAMTLSGMHVLDGKVFTTVDGMALDTFWLHDSTGGAVSEAVQLARLATTIKNALNGNINLKQELTNRTRVKGRTRVFTIEPRVLIENRASDSHTVIEVNGRDRPGLLYDVTIALSNLGLTISSAHIATFGERAVDVFYVCDMAGKKIAESRHIKKIRRSLFDAIVSQKLPPISKRVNRKAERQSLYRIYPKGKSGQRISNQRHIQDLGK